MKETTDEAQEETIERRVSATGTGGSRRIRVPDTRVSVGLRSTAAVLFLAVAAACGGEFDGSPEDAASAEAAPMARGPGGAPSAFARDAPAAEIEFPEEWRYSADTPPVTAERAMVSTVDAYATDIGLEVLRDGGNAVDAAVAVSFALAVVNPVAGNIGGGGFMVLREADGTVSTLDYREKAPLAASRDMYLDENGNVTDRSVVGHLASGVPGSVAGLWEAHRRFGTLPWDQLVEPAITLAEGFQVREKHAEMLADYRESLSRFEGSAETFYPTGEPAREGEIFRQPDLAATLTRIRDEGADGFYTGRTADLVVAEMERGGGIISHRDLESYEPRWREPIEFQYRGHTVYSMPPASSGGATMALMAHMLEGFDLPGMEWHSPEHVHLEVETWKRAYIDRNTYLADTDFVDVPLDRFTDPTYAAERRAGISRERATPSEEVLPGLGPAPEAAPTDESEQTTHFSVVDADGNAVALTTTLNSGFGSKVTVSGAGFVLNNEMDDFSAKPGAPNQYGLVEGTANAVQPGKRMLSSMTPSIVVGPDGGLRMVTGSPGGPSIITTSFQTISNVVDFGMNAAQAVLAPRVHHQHLPDQLEVEENGLAPATVEALEAMGHNVRMRGGVDDNAQVILVREDGTLEGIADPRREGRAVGF